MMTLHLVRLALPIALGLSLLISPAFAAEDWQGQTRELVSEGLDEHLPGFAPAPPVRGVEGWNALELVPSGPMAPGGQLRLAAEPVSDTRLLIPGLGRNRGDVVDAVMTPDGEEIHFSGFRSRKIEKRR